MARVATPTIAIDVRRVADQAISPDPPPGLRPIIDGRRLPAQHPGPSSLATRAPRRVGSRHIHAAVLHANVSARARSLRSWPLVSVRPIVREPAVLRAAQAPSSSAPTRTALAKAAATSARVTNARRDGRSRARQPNDVVRPVSTDVALHQRTRIRVDDQSRFSTTRSATVRFPRVRASGFAF